MKRMATLTAVSLVMGVGLVTGTAQALETKIVVVDCPTQSLQALIDSVPTKPDFAAVLVVKGTCFEDVTLEFFDDVTFTGDELVAGTISGTLTIVGARRVVINNLTVTGPGDGIVGTDGATFTVALSAISNNAGNGIVGTNGATFTVANSDISNNDRSGIIVRRGSLAKVFNNTIHDNGVAPNNGVGIEVLMGGSFAEIIDNDIQNSLNDGVFLKSNATAKLDGNTINNSGLTTGGCGISALNSGSVKLSGGNTVTNSGFAAICAHSATEFNQHSDDVPDTIVQRGCPQSCLPGTLAVRAAEHSNVNFGNVNITGEIRVDVLSSFSALNGPITGDVFVGETSGAAVDGTVSFTGTLTCGDGSFSYGAVQCGQTCSGDVPETCFP